ncbi:MAG: hypothetical protein RIR33_3242 [Pseudomonadota bacterium]|jgi:hypothetical protein
MGSPSLTRAPPAQGFAPESKRLGNAVRYCGTQIQLERFAIVMKHNLHVGCSWRIRLA